jgi:hypothetical protein
MDKKSRDQRLQIMLSPEEIAMVDDFRFKTRMPTRSAAMRELLRRGLESKSYTDASDTKSSERDGA